ncbi:DUF551 domain-containing protein [Enterobacter hormaechei]|uniref:DUF551 domain-containing protein n=1 Tax=Enterobacter hormaechei TaxID=158836 RepID=UPI00079865D4|nr:DUF551 domain-containing protein [Enterobacter hormaechei]KZR21904.1 hypothetical protein A3N67_10405 [Enterobacter hormaechei subsp. steigerwaltii]SAC75805.1 Protein of uncharacterised function (DUF551) [Enterobacter hormaechei]
MITLTKEWLLKTIAELEEERDAVPGAVNGDAAMAIAAMKLAMASLEAEPVVSHLGSKNALDAIVAFIKSNRNPTLKDYNEVSERLFQDNCHGLSNHVIEYIKQIGEELEELRSTQDTAPPAPVVPDEIESTSGSDYDDYYCDGWNSCRAAMLQGVENAETPTTMQTAPALDSSPKIAESPTGINQGKSEPVTTANKLPFEQWLSQQTGTIDVECGCVMTEVFFHWLRVAYEAGNSPVIPDGWVACSERMPDIGTEIFYFCKDDGLRDCGIVSSSNFSGRGDAQLNVHAEGYDLRLGVDITHWMPLPAAPQQGDSF